MSDGRKRRAGWSVLKWRWLDQVDDDPAMTCATKVVAHAITRHISRRTMTCSIGEGVLAEKANVSLMIVRRARGALVDAGHLELAEQRMRPIVKGA